MTRPAPEMVWKAIDIYLKQAYIAPPPLAVQARLEALSACTDAGFYGCKAFEHCLDVNTDRFSLRLGNRHYPYMKLVIERAPGDRGYVFSADTHDRHACPEPGAADYAPFQALIQQNLAIATEIEALWAQQGVMTMSQVLVADLEKRRSSAPLPRPPSRP